MRSRTRRNVWIEAALVDRLQQVVERLRPKGIERVLIERRDEHDDRQRLLRNARDHVESGQARHLDVQEDELVAARAIASNASRPFGAMCDDAKPGCWRVAARCRVARALAVVDDDRRDRCGGGGRAHGSVRVREFGR